MSWRTCRNKEKNNYINAMQVDTCDFEYQFKGQHHSRL